MSRLDNRSTSPSPAYELMPFDDDGPPFIQYSASVTEEADRRSASSTTLLKEPKLVPDNTISKAVPDLLGPPPWHPFWLRRRILGAFCILFICMTAALVFLIAYGRGRDGLTGARDNLAYLWRFGPTACRFAVRPSVLPPSLCKAESNLPVILAVITIIAIFWSRVELQAMRYTPWMNMQRTDLDLDYTAMLPPFVLLDSFKRKHFLVFSATVVTILLKVQIVLSPSIFQAVLVWTTHETEGQVLDVLGQINSTTQPGTQTSTSSHVWALTQFDIEPPFGVSDTCAYQTFSPSNQEGTSSRPTVDEPFTAVVQGLFMDTDCLLLDHEKSKVTVQPGSGPFDMSELWFHFSFDTCEGAWGTNQKDIETDPEADPVLIHVLEPLRAPYDRPCAALPQEHPQFAYFVARKNYTTSPNNVTIPQAEILGGVICSAYAWMSDVEVIDDGTKPQVRTPSGEASRTPLPDIQPWALFESSVFTESSDGGLNYYPVQLYYGLTGRKALGEDEGDVSLYQSTNLGQAVKALAQSVGPILAHYELREMASQPLLGSVATQQPILRMNVGVCVSIAVLSILCGCLALVVVRSHRRLPVSHPRNPTTLLGSVLHVRQPDTDSNHALLDSGPTSQARSKAQWSTDKYRPLVLKSWFRAASSLFALGLLSGFSYSLSASERSEGLLTVNKDGYAFMVWQSMPTLALLAISVYSSSVDTALRGLAVLNNLSTRPCRVQELDMSFLDMLGIRALFHSVQYHAPAISLSQVLTTLCIFLPTVGSLLFNLEPIPGHTDTAVQGQSWFGYRNVDANDSTTYSFNRWSVADLGLVRNLASFTYPRNTYDDLVFPTFQINDPDWETGRSAHLTVPAAKLTANCKALPRDEYDIVFNRGSAGMSRGRVDYILTEAFTCPDGSWKNYTHASSGSYGHSEHEISHFGIDDDVPGDISFIGELCGDEADQAKNETGSSWRLRTYLWGTFSNLDLEVDRLTAWRCNYSWSEVTTEVNMLWSDENKAGVIDHENPPTQDRSTERPWMPPFHIPRYDGFRLGFGASAFQQFTRETTKADFALSPQFRGIQPPFGSLNTLEAFGRAEKDQEVLDALNSYLAFCVAQLANIESRLDLNETSDSSPARYENPRAINGTILDDSRHRLVQDPKITAVIVTILGIVAVVNVWALISALWKRLAATTPGDDGRRAFLLDMELKGVAPEGFNSVSMTEALIRGSNISRFFPEDAHLMSRSQLHEHLAGRQFRIGWFLNTDTGEEVYTVGVLGDDQFVFKGKKGKSRKSYERIEEAEGVRDEQ